MIFLLKILNNSLGETNKLNWHPDKSSEFGIFQPAKQEREEPEGWWAGHVKFQLAARAKRRQEEKKERFHDSKHNLTTSPPHQRRPTKWRWRRDWADSISRFARTQRAKEIKGKHTHRHTKQEFQTKEKRFFIAAPAGASPRNNWKELRNRTIQDIQTHCQGFCRLLAFEAVFIFWVDKRVA